MMEELEERSSSLPRSICNALSSIMHHASLAPVRIAVYGHFARFRRHTSGEDKCSETHRNTSFAMQRRMTHGNTHVTAPPEKAIWHTLLSVFLKTIPFSFCHL
jgi:hypothetical protein